MSKFFADINVDQLLKDLKTNCDEGVISSTGNAIESMEDAIATIKTLRNKNAALKEDNAELEDKIEGLRKKLLFMGEQYAQLAAFDPEE